MDKARALKKIGARRQECAEYEEGTERWGHALFTQARAFLLSASLDYIALAL